MATKSKGKILENQLLFNFEGQDFTHVSKYNKEKKNETKIEKMAISFRKEHVNVKPSHLKKSRKVRKF